MSKSTDPPYCICSKKEPNNRFNNVYERQFHFMRYTSLIFNHLFDFYSLKKLIYLITYLMQ